MNSYDTETTQTKTVKTGWIDDPFDEESELPFEDFDVVDEDEDVDNVRLRHNKHVDFYT